MKNIAQLNSVVPSYAVNLLMAAKSLLHSGGDQRALLENLQAAVIAFEEKMPIRNGEVMEFKA